MLDKKNKPSEEEIGLYLGNDAEIAWNEITTFLKDNYDFTPEMSFGGVKYGWGIKYRRSGKTLCTLYPEKGAFTILIVLGKNEVAEVEKDINEFKEYVKDIFHNAHQYHDGRWLWIRVKEISENDDIKKLLMIKKKI